MTYNFTLYDGTPLVTVGTLESNGIGSLSTPRQVVDVTFDVGANAFILNDDVTSRFQSGFAFDVIQGAFEGSYVVDGAGSSYDATTRRTTVPVTSAIQSSPSTVISVEPGAGGIWIIEGVANGAVVYYPGASFTVAGAGAGDGTYTVDQSETSGSYSISAVDTGTGVWSIAGDYVSFFAGGVTFKVVGSNPGAGTYTVVSAVLNGSDTDITVVESIPGDATTGGLATPFPAVTRITVTTSIPLGSGSTGTATVPPSIAYAFSSAPTMLTSTGGDTYSIIWHLTGNYEGNFVVGSTVLIKSNDIFDQKAMTVISATNNGANTDVTVAFRHPSLPDMPDASGSLTYPLPPLPHGFIQYTVDTVASSLMLVGRGAPAYNNSMTWGQALQENDIHLAENFRTSDGVPPPAPLTGQQWYDELNTALQLFASTKYTIVGVDTGTKTWTISGNHAAEATLAPGKTITVYNDTADQASYVYEVDTITNNGANTDIVVVEVITQDANGDGQLYSMDDWHGVVVEGLPVTGDIDMNGHDISGLGISSTDDVYPLLVDSSSAVSVDFADARYVNSSDTAGDSMAGPLDMSANKITGVANPTDPQDAMTLAYAETTYVNVTGDVMSGDLDMSGNIVTDLALPINGTDAANKAYVDSLTSGLVWIEPLLEPNLFDDTLAGPDTGTAADIADPYMAYHRAFLVKPAAYTIVGVNTTTDVWSITGNYATRFIAGQSFVVDGNTDVSSNIAYEVVSAVDNGANTDITVIATSIPGTAAADGTLYHARGAWNGLDGHVVSYDPNTTAWVDVVTLTNGTPRAVQAGDRFGIFMVPDNDDPLSTLPGGSFVNNAGGIFIIDSVSTPDYTVVWTPYTPLEPEAVSVVGNNSSHFGLSYTFRGTYMPGDIFGTDYKWIQFAGPSMIVDGVGLRYNGNILNVDISTGLEFNGDEIQIDGAYFDGLYMRQDTSADLIAIEALGATGFPVRTGLNTWTQRAVDTASATRITMTNGDGIAGNPTVDLATLADSGTGTFLKLARDTYGRVSGTTAVVVGDITALVDATYVNVSGDSMAAAANLTFVGGGEVLGLPTTPSGATAATSKDYVDGRTSGIQTEWIPASRLIARTTDGAAAGTTESITNRVMVSTFDFDQTTSEFAQFNFAFPKGWNLGNITAEFYWTAAAGGGTVEWNIQAVALSNDDAIDSAFGTPVAVTDTLLTADDLHRSPVTASITIGGAPQEGDLVYFQVFRNTSNDTLTADAKLIGVKFFYTVTTLNDA